jgi:hypothetical protein
MDKWHQKETENDLLDHLIRENREAEEQLKETGTPSMKGLMDPIKKTNKQNQHQNTRGDNTVWTVQGMKGVQKDIEDTNEQTSTKFLPRNLPLFELVVLDDSAMTNIIPVMVFMKDPRLTTYAFENSRFLVAMIKLLQMLFQDTYIGPINNEDQTTKRIAHLTQIPTNNNEVLKYMFTLNCTNGVWATKINIHSNNKLKDFLNNDEFRNYLLSEQITIEYNKLNTIIPTNIGFLEQMVPNRESKTLQHARLVELLPINAPEFQINVYRCYGYDKKPASLIMIQTEKQNA